MNRYTDALEDIDENVTMEDYYVSTYYRKKIILQEACDKAKAYDIIMKKRIDVYALVIAYDLEDYNNMIKHTYELTQEEFDVLREVLVYEI